MQQSLDCCGKGVIETVTRYIDLDTARALAELCPVGYREMLLWAVGTGFRIEDLCAAEDWRYDRDAKSLIIRESKTDKRREADVPAWLAADFADYDARHKYRLYLVETPEGRKLCRQTVWRWIHRAWRELSGKDADRLGPHSLRKCYAVERRKHGAKLADVQADFGHDNKTTTMIYYYSDQIDAADV